MSKVIAISNQKGGVGKTTTAVNLSCGLARLGKKVLLIDLDAQGNASYGLGAVPEPGQNTIYHVLLEDLPIEEAIVHKDVPHIDILPSNTMMSGADGVLNRMEDSSRDLLLRQAIEPVRDQYDFIFIDCPPSLGLLNTNALAAADTVLIPIQCEYYALEGVTQLLLSIRLVQKTSNPHLSIEGALMTMFDIRTRLSVEVSQEVRKTFGQLCYQNSIPRNVKLCEAPSRGLSIFEYDPRSSGAMAYAELAKEFLKRGDPQ